MESRKIVNQKKKLIDPEKIKLEYIVGVPFGIVIFVMIVIQLIKAIL